MPMESHAGDHLISRRTCYTHHGLYAGNGKVIHYAGFSTAWKPGKVEEIDLSGFQAGQALIVHEYKKQKFTREESIARARARIGEDLYCLMANNCEQFVHWCITGEHFSSQVNKSAHGANGFVAGFGTVGAVLGVAEAGIVSGLSGSGVMSGLASIGSLVGGGAVAGLGMVSAIPGAASALVLNYTLLKDSPGLNPDERGARQGGRVGTVVGAASATAGGLLAVGAMGSVAGFSASGITTGLAAIGSTTGAGAALSAVGIGGGMMIGGVVVTVAAPALLAAITGYGTYRGIKWLKEARRPQESIENVLSDK